MNNIQPQARELEEVVLGAIMLEKDAYEKVSDLLMPEHFYASNNEIIYSCMRSLAANNMPIDLTTVVEELNKKKQLETVGGAYGVSKLTNTVVSSAHIETHAKIIVQKFICREVIKVCAEISQLAYDQSLDVFDMLDTAEDNILKIGAKIQQSEMVHISTVVKDAIIKIEDWRKNEGTLTGVTSGFAGIDKATRGWQPGDLIILGARPSTGKTAFALNLATNAAFSDKKVTVAIWSLEMKAVYLALRMMAAESEVWLHQLQTGRMSESEMQKLTNGAAEKLAKANIFFDEKSNVNLRSLRNKARKLKKKHNLGMIIIDYVQLMAGEDKNGNREREIAIISRGLKELAQELEIPIIALSQLSRESTKTVTWDNGPGTNSLRESGALEQDADIVLMLWGANDAEIQEDNELDGKRRVKIAKQRNGMLHTTEFDFKNEIQLFESIENVSSGKWKPIKPGINFSESLKEQETEPF